MPHRPPQPNPSSKNQSVTQAPCSGKGLFIFRRTGSVVACDYNADPASFNLQLTGGTAEAGRLRTGPGAATVCQSPFSAQRSNVRRRFVGTVGSCDCTL